MVPRTIQKECVQKECVQTQRMQKQPLRLQRMQSRRMMTMTPMLISVVLVACASGGAQPTTRDTPSPAVSVPRTDTAVSVPVAPRPRVTRVMLPLRTQDSRYAVESVARVERDSSGRKESAELRTRALVSFNIERDSVATRGTGVVDSFTVAGLEQVGGRASAPMSPLMVPFEFTIDSMQVRVSVRPALSNLCDAPETGATNLVRELLVRLPRQLDSGAAWSDSSASFICRAGVPITIITRSSYIVDRVDAREHGPEVTITRTMQIALDGASTVAWRARSVRGTGTGTQSIRIDGRTGALMELTGQSTLLLDVGTDRIRQENELRVRAVK